MKKSVVVSSILLALSGLGFAKTAPLFLEASSGAVVGLTPGFGVAASVRIGQDDLFGNFAGRVQASLGLTGGGSAFSLGADLIYPFTSRGTKDWYAGFGASVVSGGGTYTTEHLFVGSYFALTKDAGVAAELKYSMFDFTEGSLGAVAGLRIYL